MSTVSNSRDLHSPDWLKNFHTSLTVLLQAVKHEAMWSSIVIVCCLVVELCNFNQKEYGNRFSDNGVSFAVLDCVQTLLLPFMSHTRFNVQGILQHS